MMKIMDKDIIIKKSKIDKKGVFAARNFEKGEVVLKWNPKILEYSEIGKLKSNQKEYLNRVGRNKYYLMQSPEKFVNHSCMANTKAKNNCDIAIRDIMKGEEITTDYGKISPVSFECKCGSKNCRSAINKIK